MWDVGSSYDRFMGRWSALLAERFLSGLHPISQGAWLDVGCGTGSLIGAVARAHPERRLVGIDPSVAFTDIARQRWSTVADVTFDVGSAERLPYDENEFAVAVSGLALNFVPDPVLALREMYRVTRPGGTVAAFVWDYDLEDFFLSRFWTAAHAVSGAVAEGDERGRWPICTDRGLRDVVRHAGLVGPTFSAIEIQTVFADVEELWGGFTLGVGPAGEWLASSDDAQVHAVRAHLEAGLVAGPGGTVDLPARAWSFSSRVPDAA